MAVTKKIVPAVTSPVQTVTPQKTPLPIAPPILPVPQPQYDTSTLSGRLLAANVPPTSAGIDNALRNEMLHGVPINQSQIQTVQQENIKSSNIATAIQQNKGALQLIGQITPEQQQQAQNQIGIIEGGVLPTSSEIGGALPGTVAAGIGGAGSVAVGGALGITAATSGVAAIAAGAFAAINIISGLKQEAQEETAIQSAGYAASIKNIKAIEYDLNHGGDPTTDVALYNIELAKIAQEESNLKALSERDWLSKAKPKLTTIRLFYSGTKQMHDAKIAQAIIKPDSSAAFDAEAETLE